MRVLLMHHAVLSFTLACAYLGFTLRQGITFRLAVSRLSCKEFDVLAVNSILGESTSRFSLVASMIRFSYLNTVPS